MNYKEMVEERIQEESCKNLWREISAAYEQGGENGIKTVLSKKADEIVNDFQKSLKQLEEKL